MQTARYSSFDFSALLEHPRIWGLMFILLLGLTAVSSMRMALHAPLEGHEAYVVETAQQMLERNDWILPYFNNEPRLKKPPLNYWLTAAITRMTGSDRVLPWHGRLPSVIAGLLFVLLTVQLGLRLFDRETAFLAGLMLASTIGYLKYSYNARPEMVYALFCVLCMVAFLHAQSAPDRSIQQRLYAGGVWLSFALATLAKGPHIPIILLVTLIIFCGLRGPGWGRCLRSLRPVMGLLLLATLVLPWWFALQHRLPAGVIEHSQLSGELILKRWSHEFSLYYLYVPARKLFMPWALFLPCLLGLRRSTGRVRENTLLLGTIYGALVVALSLNNHARPHYMLPALMPGCLLLATGMVTSLRLCETRSAQRTARNFLVLLGTVAVLGLAIALYLDLKSANSLPPFDLLFALAVILPSLLVSMLLSRKQWLAPASHVIVGGLLSVVAAGGLVGTTLRFEQAGDPTTRVVATIALSDSNAPVASWEVNPASLVYYLRRSIPVYENPGQVLSALTGSTENELLLIAPVEKLAQLPPPVQVTLLMPAVGKRQLTVAWLQGPANHGLLNVSLTNH